MTHQPRSCDVVRTAREVTASLAPLGGAKAVTSAPSDLPIAAHVDPRHLTRILTNLVANGLRHADSTVTITPRRDGAVVIIDVVDDGPGVPVERREAIFQRFVTFDSE